MLLVRQFRQDKIIPWSEGSATKHSLPALTKQMNDSTSIMHPVKAYESV